MQQLTKDRLALLRKIAATGRAVPVGPEWTSFYVLQALGLIRHLAYSTVEITPEGREVLAKLGDQP